MARKIKIIIIISLIFVFFTHLQNKRVETQNNNNEESVANCVKMKFRYIITENTIQSSNFRKIEVFLDEKEFSVENLKELFSYLSSKYPEPKYLTVLVKTNWAQLQFPSDCPGIGRSNVPVKPDEFDYHQAIYYRRGGNEYFRYSVILKSDKLETYVIKGKSP